MYVVLSVLLIIACLLLGMVILVQNPREGGTLAGFGAGFSSRFMGIQQTADILEKATWILMGIIAFLVIVMGLFL